MHPRLQLAALLGALAERQRVQPCTAHAHQFCRVCGNPCCAAAGESLPRICPACNGCSWMLAPANAGQRHPEIETFGLTRQIARILRRAILRHHASRSTQVH